jgi:hypothetical protein
MTMNSTNFHNEERTGQRRVAVQAAIRADRNMGRVWSAAAVLLGAGVAAMLSGFALWTPIVSAGSIVASFTVAIVLAWAGAMLLPNPSSGVLWFVSPLTVGIFCAAIMREWSAFGVLIGCTLVPLVSLALYRTDTRRPA